MAEKVKIEVHTPFTLNLGEDKKKAFKAGAHTVSQDTADHWYTKLHSKTAEEAAEEEAEDEANEDLELAKEAERQIAASKRKS